MIYLIHIDIRYSVSPLDFQTQLVVTGKKTIYVAPFTANRNRSRDALTNSFPLRLLGAFAENLKSQRSATDLEIVSNAFNKLFNSYQHTFLYRSIYTSIQFSIRFDFGGGYTLRFRSIYRAIQISIHFDSVHYMFRFRSM